MQIEMFDGGFSETIPREDIDKILFFYSGVCEIHYKDRTVSSIHIPSSVYNVQYGIPVSHDGSLLFVSNYDVGVTAYDTKTGNEVWSVSEKKIRNIDVFYEYITMVKTHMSLIKADWSTGERKDIIKGAFSKSFCVDERYLLLETDGKTLCLVDTENMSLVKRYSQNLCNPDRYLSWCIIEAFVKDGALTIRGFEQYPYGNYSNQEKRDFERVIDFNIISGN